LYVPVKKKVFAPKTKTETTEEGVTIPVENSTTNPIE
jgi:hypothetical protein